MEITIGDTVLCAGQERNKTGSPIGPEDFRGVDAPGVVTHDYVGAEREHPELIRCNHGSISFGVTRTFANIGEAAAYMATDFWTEGSTGELRFGSRTIFATACVTQRAYAWVGCTVQVSYTIEG